MLEKFLFVEDFDCDVIIGLDVPSELDLGEIALAQGPPKLVLPHTRPAAAAAAIVAAARPRHLPPAPSPSPTWLSLSKIPFFFLFLKPLRLRSQPLLLAGLPYLRLNHPHRPLLNSPKDAFWLTTRRAFRIWSETLLNSKTLNEDRWPSDETKSPWIRLANQTGRATYNKEKIKRK